MNDDERIRQSRERFPADAARIERARLANPALDFDQAARERGFVGLDDEAPAIVARPTMSVAMAQQLSGRKLRERYDNVNRPRVAVGGSLHGQVLNVACTSTAVYRAQSDPAEVGVDAARLDPAARYWAVGSIEVYEVRDHQRTSAGNVGLLIASDLLKSAGSPVKGNGLNETIVEALAIAAGVFGNSPRLTRGLTD